MNDVEEGTRRRVTSLDSNGVGAEGGNRKRKNELKGHMSQSHYKWLLFNTPCTVNSVVDLYRLDERRNMQQVRAVHASIQSNIPVHSTHQQHSSTTSKTHQLYGNAGRTNAKVKLSQVSQILKHRHKASWCLSHCTSLFSHGS